VLRLKRIHNTGTQTVLSQSVDGWRVNIDLREANHNPVTIVGYLLPTLEEAKQLADQEIVKHGHVCGAEYLIDQSPFRKYAEIVKVENPPRRLGAE